MFEAVANIGQVLCGWVRVRVFETRLNFDLWCWCSHLDVLLYCILGHVGTSKCHWCFSHCIIFIILAAGFLFRWPDWAIQFLLCCYVSVLVTPKSWMLLNSLHLTDWESTEKINACLNVCLNDYSQKCPPNVSASAPTQKALSQPSFCSFFFATHHILHT